MEDIDGKITQEILDKMQNRRMELELKDTLNDISKEEKEELKEVTKTLKKLKGA